MRRFGLLVNVNEVAHARGIVVDVRIAIALIKSR